VFEVAEQISPRLGGLAMAVGDGHQLLRRVDPDVHDDQGAQASLLQSHVEVDAVDRWQRRLDGTATGKIRR